MWLELAPQACVGHLTDVLPKVCLQKATLLCRGQLMQWDKAA